MKPAKEFVYPLLLIFIVFMIYGNTIGNQTAHDDYLVITESIKKGFGGIKEIIKNKEANSADYIVPIYRPVRQLFTAITVGIFGYSYKNLHLLNISIFSLVVLLVYNWLRKLLPQYNAFYIFLICLVFATHTIHVEVVANIKSLDVALAGLFGIMGLWSTQKYIESKQKIYLLILLPLALLSILAKKDGLLYFGLIPFLFLFQSNRPINKIDIQILKKNILYLFLFLIGLSTILLAYKKISPKTDKILIENKIYAGNQYYYIEDQMDLFATKLWVGILQIKNLITPHNLFYNWAYKTIDTIHPLSLEFIVSLVTFISLAIISIKLTIAKSKLGLFLLCFLICLLPYLQILKLGPDTAADRFLFASSIFYAITIVLLCAAIFKIDLQSNFPIQKTNGRLFLAIVLGYSVYLSSLTINRNKIWENNTTLYTADIKKLPNNSIANYLYAQATYAEAVKANKLQDELPKIKKHLDITLAMTPQFIPAQQFATLLISKTSDSGNAISKLDSLISSNSKDGRLYYSKAILEIENNDWINAEQNLIQSLKMGYNPVDVLDQLFVIAYNQNDLSKAKKWKAELKAMDNTSLIPELMEAKIYSIEGKIEEAIALFNKVLKKDPTHKKNIVDFAGYLLKRGNQYEADLILQNIKADKIN